MVGYASRWSASDTVGEKVGPEEVGEMEGDTAGSEVVGVVDGDV